MRKFFTFLFLSLVGLLAFSASAATVILNIDDPSRVEVLVNNEPYQGAFVAGDNVVQSFRLTIRATEGNLLESVIWENGSYDIPVSNNEASFGTLTEGAKYYITTKPASEVRKGIVRLEVDKASAVKVAFDETLREVSLNDGINSIEYNAEKEKTLKIYSSVSAQMPLFSVTVEGGDSNVGKKGNVYFIALPCAGTVKVVSQFPDTKYCVSLNFSEGAAGFVKKITRDSSSGEELEIKDNTVWVKGGTALYIHGDQENYLLQSYMVDGVEQSFASPQRLIVADRDVEVSFNAEKYPEFTVSVTVDNPEAVTAFYGSTLYPGAQIALVKGVNTVTLNINRNSLLFIPADSHKFKITSVTHNGMNLEPNYDGKVQVPDLEADDKIVITTREIVRDLHAVVYLDNAAENLWTLKDNFGNEIPLQTGYNHIMVCADDNPLSLCEGYGMPYVFVNDELVGVSGGFLNKAYNFTLSEGSVAKIFVDCDDEPAFYPLTFSEKGFDAVDVTADEIRPITDRVGYEVLAATKIQIAPKKDKKVSVSVDDSALQADADGTYSFVVTAPHQITITEDSSGLEVVDAVVGTGECIIYNLQGMRMPDSDVKALPTGLYIVNGQKILVK